MERLSQLAAVFHVQFYFEVQVTDWVHCTGLCVNIRLRTHTLLSFSISQMKLT